MRSFSSLVKEYLCSKSLEELGIGVQSREKWNECCSKSFLRGLFLFSPKKEEGIVFTEKQEMLAEIVAFLLIRIYGIEIPVQNFLSEGKKCFAVSSKVVEKVLNDTEPVSEIRCDRCRVLFVRAAFLSCGTVLDPRKGYHGAFSPRCLKGEEELLGVLSCFDLIPKRSVGEKGVLLYWKESGKVEDLLSVVGAQRFSLKMMNQKIEKSIRGNINRRQNFDEANLKKTVDGAQSVIAAIHFLQENGVLETVSEPLQKAAQLRLNYPEVSLKDLVDRSEEEITKSGLNHRFQKILRIAENLKKEKMMI